MSYRRSNQRPEISEIKEGFEMFNTEKSELIDPAELRDAINSLNLKDKIPLIYELIDNLCKRKDIQRKGGISPDEFISYVEDQMRDPESREGLKKLFNVFCDNNTEKIPMNNFCQVARDIGNEETGEDLHNLIEDADMGGKELDFNEFSDIMNSKPTKTYFRKRPENNKPKETYSYRSKKVEEEPEDVNNPDNDPDNKAVYSYKRVKVEQKQPIYGKPVVDQNVQKKEIVIERYDKPEVVKYEKYSEGSYRRGGKEPELVSERTNVVITGEIITTEAAIEKEVQELGKDTGGYHYRNSRGSKLNENSERVNTDNNDEKGDGSDSKRYHRRYRENNKPNPRK